MIKLYALAINGLCITALFASPCSSYFPTSSHCRQRSMASWFDWLAKCENVQWRSHVHVDCCWKVFFAWADPLKNKTGKSILKAFTKNSKQKRAEDVVFCKRSVVSSLPTSFFKIHLFNGTKSRNKIFHHRANDQNAFVSNLAILHIQKLRTIRRRASRFSRSYNATFHRSIKRSDHWWLSHSQLAIVQQIGQAHCSL